MKLNSNTIIIVVTTLALAAGAYWYFFTGTGTDAPLSTSTSDNQVQTRFQTLITQLPASFDTSIFSDPSFTALIDITTPIQPETSGRLDPFASISTVLLSK